MTSISLTAVPDYTGVAERVQAAAGGLRKVAPKIQATGTEVNDTWTRSPGLAPFYKAPEAAQLLAAMGPVKAAADTVTSQTMTVSAALEEFAAAVAKIQQQLNVLKADIVSFNQDVMGDPDAMEDDAKRDRHNDLLQRIEGWGRVAFENAERLCANKINALTGGPHYVPGDFGGGHDGRLPPGYQRYGWVKAPAGMPTPWGKPIEEPDPWWQRTLKGFGGAGWSMVTGTFSLVDFTNWETFKTSWGGLYNLAYGASPTTWVEAATGDKDARTAMGAWKNMGKEIIGWDKAKEGNWAGAAGQAAFNVPTALFSFTKLGKGGTAAARGAGKAVTGLGNTGARAAGGIADAINGLRGSKIPQISDPGTIRFHLPETPARNPADLPTVGGLRREIDQIGKPHEPAFNELDRRPGTPPRPGDDLPDDAKPQSPTESPRIPAMAGAGGRTPHEINAAHNPPGPGGNEPPKPGSGRAGNPPDPRPEGIPPEGVGQPKSPTSEPASSAGDTPGIPPRGSDGELQSPHEADPPATPQNDPKLPKTHHDVADQVETIRNQIKDRLQKAADDAWQKGAQRLRTEDPDLFTEDPTLIGKGGVKAGTFAHSALGDWLNQNADRLIDPKNGYRMRSEVPFDELGAETRIPASLPRWKVYKLLAQAKIPDIIIERQKFTKSGEVQWEVVHVYDLKTGYKGITDDWADAINKRIKPITPIEEVRPTDRSVTAIEELKKAKKWR